MNDEEQPGEAAQGGWVEQLLDGGLPQVIAGPGGKAISRLIGAGADIPAAWLEGIAQGVRDKTEARSVVSRALAEKAADLAVGDPAVVERAMVTTLGRAYRAQVNKDAVAKVTVAELEKSPPPADSEGPSEDFLNKFERYAEDASGEDVRLMFGRLLAEEVRKPGAISIATMRFVSELDSEVARLIERALPMCTVTGHCYRQFVSPELTYEECTQIAQSGFWTFDRSMRAESRSDESGTERIPLREGRGVSIKYIGSRTLSLQVAMLSKVGRDLVEITDVPFDLERFLAGLGKEPKVVEARAAQCFRTPKGWQFVEMSVSIQEVRKE